MTEQRTSNELIHQKAFDSPLFAFSFWKRGHLSARVHFLVNQFVFGESIRPQPQKRRFWAVSGLFSGSRNRIDSPHTEIKIPRVVNQIPQKYIYSPIGVNNIYIAQSMHDASCVIMAGAA